MKPSTEKIVNRIVDDYRRAAKTVAQAERRHDQEMDLMTPSSFEADAEAIQTAYDQGKFEDVAADDVQSLMEKYGATDIYHLTASYFNATGKILNVK